MGPSPQPMTPEQERARIFDNYFLNHTFVDGSRLNDEQRATLLNLENMYVQIMSNPDPTQMMRAFEDFLEFSNSGLGDIPRAEKITCLLWHLLQSSGPPPCETFDLPGNPIQEFIRDYYAKTIDPQANPKGLE